MLTRKGFNIANCFQPDSDEEDVVGEEPTTCLFCTETCSCIEKALEHIKKHHNVDFSYLRKKFHMDQYSFIKLINCIRQEQIKPDKLLEATESFWEQEIYLKPKEYEAWLTYDYENMESESDYKRNDVENENLSLNEIIKKQKDELEQAAEHLAVMNRTIKRLLDKEDGKAKSVHQSDSHYFDSYSHFSIHHEMLSDTVRTNSYRDALLKNKDFIKGRDVLDVGCGTAILSIFASQAGAKKVVGIDNSEIIYNAMGIVRKNNIDNIALIKGRLEDTVLPQEKYDVIVSEWMGYFLLFEGMLDTIIYARDNHLASQGNLLPNRCTMSIVGYGDDGLFKQHISFWNNVYDVDMSVMCNEVMREPLIEIVDAKNILTEPNCIADLNLLTVDLNYSNFSHDLHLLCKKDGTLSALVGYFDTYFDLPEPVMFTTSPFGKPTHWKQVVFFVGKPIQVRSGDIVKGRIRCSRSVKSNRSLEIVIEIDQQKYFYYLD
uniref:type I protein arginine methyltransferase n=1 Tax=Glossina brevipalpis TaxID=37001 RepID=A0A1A9WLU6_9MUSC